MTESDKLLTCQVNLICNSLYFAYFSIQQSCKEQFVFTQNEQEKYKERNFCDPKSCLKCRNLKKSANPTGSWGNSTKCFNEQIANPQNKGPASSFGFGHKHSSEAVANRFDVNGNDAEYYITFNFICL